MEVVGFLALAALVIKIVSFVKAIGKDNNLVVTQLLVWLIGTGVLLLAAASATFESIVIPGLDVTIGSLDFASTILAGLMLGSSGSFAYDATIGRGRSEPSLLT